MSDLLTAFEIPEHLHASSPIERRGLDRDQVRMMLLDPVSGRRAHTNFRNIVDTFQAGDVLVLNQSRTIPSSLQASGTNGEVEVRLARKIDDHRFEVLLVGKQYKEGEKLYFQDGLFAVVEKGGSEYPLQVLKFKLSGMSLIEYIYDHGSPIYYEYVEDPWPLNDYQNVYSSTPGSIEMASAGRAFTWGTITELEQKGVKICYITLHTSLSYYENDRWPSPSSHPEPYTIPQETVTVINKAKQEGRQVAAVGTTVVRALESAFKNGQLTKQDSVLTYLYINQEHSLKVVDALLTGFHEPEASHLDLLTAFVKHEILIEAYHEAIEQQYLWHEFGDMNLIIPGRL
ncbi:S-adenosylmethionine:tRNA ribosyltransferase-isomerase [Halobacillus naozhouensis]|uniref:S-adenosylmethionine:tRNA ribosyltransferase-isomerase n=1 Tax=Halobacillus naozhouensis TaxID=554880 RepID=A0ABY8IWJ1_9BACI|nr:S-adenosylmethionine:tRNA ribosyltransferase-isomerase [Halobacillus naozhouensis]WFT74580.1 S-adenosylmethionine:tRNA ribosyltransferase-isomerase [Halobacillus naozhouensis]